MKNFTFNAEFTECVSLKALGPLFSVQVFIIYKTDLSCNIELSSTFFADDSALISISKSMKN